MAQDRIVFRLVPVDAILPLREAVIIAGTDRDSPYFEGDADRSTRHAGAFDGETCVACATFIASEWAGRPAWQVRGMAVAPERQRQGMGRRLLAFAEDALTQDAGHSRMWCNARESAVPFYQSLGWQVVGDRFIKPGVGPHFNMCNPAAGTAG